MEERPGIEEKTKSVPAEEKKKRPHLPPPRKTREERAQRYTRRIVESTDESVQSALIKALKEKDFSLHTLQVMGLFIHPLDGPLLKDEAATKRQKRILEIIESSKDEQEIWEKIEAIKTAERFDKSADDTYNGNV